MEVQPPRLPASHSSLAPGSLLHMSGQPMQYTWAALAPALGHFHCCVSKGTSADSFQVQCVTKCIVYAVANCWVVTCPHVKLSSSCQVQVCQIDEQAFEGMAYCECTAANCFMVRVPALRCYQQRQLLSCKAFQLHLAAALEPVGVPCPEHTCQAKTRGSCMQKRELLVSTEILKPPQR